MPYRPASRTLLDASGRPLTYYDTRVNEPTSGETLGTTVPFTYTPATTGERLVVRHRTGPTGRLRIDLREAGGSWSDGAAGLDLPAAGVLFEGEFRPVGLPFAGDDSEPVLVALVIVGAVGEADWRGE